MSAWKPDRSSNFSVGLSVRSTRLSPDELEFLMDRFDAGWEKLRLSRRRGPGASGCSLHVHLLDRRPEEASANLITASRVLDQETVSALIAVDSDIEIDVHAQQDLPDVGDVPSVHLSVEALAVMATSDLFAMGLDIDQYGAGGNLLAQRLMHPWLSRRFGWRHTHRIAVSSERDGAEPLDISVDPELGVNLRTLADWRVRNPGPVKSVISEQMIRVPGYQGIGLVLQRDLLKALAELDAPLELRFRTRFAL